MNISKPNIKLTAKCSRCGDDIELTAYTASLGKRDIMCRNCLRMPNKAKWTPEIYSDYLESEHWQGRRKAALKRAGNKCQVCASVERLEVHHNNYANLGGEPLTDLVVLCRDCHELFHGVV